MTGPSYMSRWGPQTTHPTFWREGGGLDPPHLAGSQYEKNPKPNKRQKKNVKIIFGRFTPCLGGGPPDPPPPYLLEGRPDHPLAGHQSFPGGGGVDGQAGRDPELRLWSVKRSLVATIVIIYIRWCWFCFNV